MGLSVDFEFRYRSGVVARVDSREGGGKVEREKGREGRWRGGAEIMRYRRLPPSPATLYGTGYRALRLGRHLSG